MGTKENPVNFYTPTMALIYLKIGERSFTAATSKFGASGKVETESFKMTTTVVETKLNTQLFGAYRDRYDQILQHLTGKSAVEFGRAVSEAIDKGA